MNARTTSQILKEIRVIARMADSGPGQGLEDDFILATLADHIGLFQSRVSADAPNIFRQRLSLTLQSGVASYALPASILNGGEIVLVQRRNALGTYTLRVLSDIEQQHFSSSAISPEGYRVIGSSIYIFPVPSSSEDLVMETNKRWPTLDLLRGVVSATASSSGAYTEISLTSPSIMLSNASSVTVSDSTGNILYPAISVVSYDSANSKLILETGANLVATGAIPVGSTVTIGSFSSTRAPSYITDPALAYLKNSVAQALRRIDGAKRNDTDLLTQMFSAAVDSLTTQIVQTQELPIYEELYNGL